MNDDLSIGDLVFLKSGSPSMVVTKIDPPTVECAWSVHGIILREWFPPAVLTKEKPEEKSEWD